MRFPPLLLALLLAGCATPAPEPEADDTIDLTGRAGTFLVDLREGEVEPLSAQTGLAWMSPSGAVVTWQEPNFAAVLLRTTNAREVAPLRVWSHVLDDATGVELTPGVAHVRHLVTGTELSNATVPAHPRGDAWERASADLRVFADVSVVAPPCRNEIIVFVEAPEYVGGCHVRVAADGRVGWTESSGVRVRANDGTTRTLAAPTNADGVFVAFENPLFTANGTLYLRLEGSGDLERTEVVDETGTVLARMEGERRLALLDVSADGRWLLASAFDG